MKLFFGFLIAAAVLTGCSSENQPLKDAMKLREHLLSANGCSFRADITADYGDSMHTFSMDCTADAEGDLTFEITLPETIAGIKGSISEEGGTVSFEETALYFGLLTDDQLTPASAPWIFLRTLRSGYISSACYEEQLLHMTVDDSYEDDPLTLDIWVNEDAVPVRGDVLYDGKRILSLEAENFVFL